MGIYKRISLLDVILLFLTLDTVSFGTPFGYLSLSYIGTLIFLLFLIKEASGKINFKGIYNYSLILIPIWFSFISTFTGTSILGNLSRVIIYCATALFLPYSKITIDNFASSIKKVILFHFTFLIFDLFFEVPWGWEGSQFVLFGGYNYSARPSGLLGEPSFYGIMVNSLYLILIILNRSKNIYGLLVVFSTAMSASVSGTFVSTFLFIYDFFKNYKNDLLKILFLKSIKKRFLSLILTLIIFTIPIVIFLSNHEFSQRIANPFQDGSIIGRTLGSYFYFERTVKESPVFGYGFGSISELKYDKKNPDTFIDFLDNGQLVHVPIGSCNVIVAITVMGGLVALYLYLQYVFTGIGFNNKLYLYLLILFCTGKVFYSILFLIPAFQKYYKINNNQLNR